jgi:class 3 adenylate cyclase
MSRFTGMPLQTVIRLTQEVIQSYAGTLMPLTSESIAVVFGAPVAQEDHARRAVLTALELRQRLHDAADLRAHRIGDRLALAIGLHSGLVVATGLGQNPHQSVTAIGIPLHLAMRRLQQAAPGTILLSAATSAVKVRPQLLSDSSVTLPSRHVPASVYFHV